MSTVKFWGIAWVLAGGIMNASFVLPMKKMTAWRWENIWLPYSVVAMVIVPWSYALATVPGLATVYLNSSWSVLAKVMLFGFGWGIGSTLFGLGISRVGMALGYALILGITASLGSLLPLALLHPERLLSKQGYLLMAGTALVICGLALLSVAGRRREQEAQAQSTAAANGGFAVGLLICLLSGVFSAMLNFSFTFGKELQDRSASLGATASASANPIWSLALTAGFLANVAYCVYLLNKNRSWHLFSGPGTPVVYWVGAVLMGLLWFGGVAAYGIGAASLGALGGIVGWPVLMAMTVIAANVLGAVTGEWRGASRRSRRYWWAGVASLVVAVYVIALGSTG
jgi:L-rhamnose-H+ transport protein